MSRIEIIGNAMLYLGDCREILPMIDRADAVVTDPPYGYGKPSGTIGKSSLKRDYDVFEDSSENVMNVCIPAFVLSLKISGGRGIVTPGCKMFPHYPCPDAFGSFFQPAATGMSVWGRSTSQPIYYYGRDPRLGKTIDRTSRQLTERVDPDIVHPCAKPIEAWSWLTWKAAIPGETILDPFMGSGTTGVCAHTHGQKFIGIEISEKYFDDACIRIEKAQRQSDLFAEVAA